MELTMTNNFGFCELNENEMMMVDGGKSNWEQVGGDIATIAGGRIGCVIGNAIAPGVGGFVGTLIGAAAARLIYTLGD